jgi:hypothetical protein
MPNRRILFVNYTYSFIPNAHNGCLRTMLSYLLRHKPDSGIVFHLASLNTQAEDEAAHAGQCRSFKAGCGGRLQHVVQYRRGAKGGWWASLTELVQANLFIRQYIAAQQIDTVYAYGETALCALGLVRAHHGLRRCLDVRGDFLGEEQDRGAGVWRRWVYRRLLNRLAPCASKIFVTSPYVEDVVRQWHPTAAFTINTNYYDETVFYPEAGNPHRETTFVYAGSTHRYQALPEMLVNGDQQAVRNQARAVGIPELDLTIATANSAAEVRQHLVQADMGFMLRDSSAGNRSAFPVKFAEYLACGVPVISTRHAPATAALIEKNALGVLVDLGADAEQSAAKIHSFLERDPDVRGKCAEFARENLSWAAHAERIMRELLG